MPSQQISALSTAPKPAAGRAHAATRIAFTKPDCARQKPRSWPHSSVLADTVVLQHAAQTSSPSICNTRFINGSFDAS
jgi:hypothetical protein